MPESADPDLSLDQFLARNTSEDNASFSELMKENEQKHRAKHAWLFEKEGFQDRVRLLLVSLGDAHVCEVDYQLLESSTKL